MADDDRSGQLYTFNCILTYSACSMFAAPSAVDARYAFLRYLPLCDILLCHLPNCLGHSHPLYRLGMRSFHLLASINWK